MRARYRPPARGRRSRGGTGRADTRKRIVSIARRLFVDQGYTATSIADIARELGTTTAALYYHFPSKADILEAVLAGPLMSYARMCDAAANRQLTIDELLNAYLDMIADSRPVLGLANDPAVRAHVDPSLPRTPDEMRQAVVAALGGRPGDRASMIRALAALGVVEGATSLLAARNTKPLSATDRAEILAAARRALDGPPTSS